MKMRMIGTLHMKRFSEKMDNGMERNDLLLFIPMV
ncbi:hypothetical protein SAMN05216235_2072 [Salinicoccus halodurans]|uniref:Uncharacterized protein n=1 Tax=Salinicoccus halodurans TaxID=407035 RepID=A0AA94KWS7_9STAP|nr:hypothetical protein SAMN05216235_2072 [Salinicoccus halodurans]